MTSSLGGGALSSSAGGGVEGGLVGRNSSGSAERWDSRDTRGCGWWEWEGRPRVEGDEDIVRSRASAQAISAPDVDHAPASAKSVVETGKYAHDYFAV